MISQHRDEVSLESFTESRISRPGNDLVCKIITDFRQLEKLQGEWQRLWHADPRAEFFQCFEWTRAWWAAFGVGVELCAPVVYENGEIALILPLVRERSTLRFLGSPQCDYADALCYPGSESELLALAFRTLLQSVPEWRECVLDHLRPDSHIVRAWSELPAEFRALTRLDRSDGCPTIVFAGKREEVLGEVLAGKHLRRRLNKLKKAGTVTFRHLEEKREAQRHLTRFFRCHRRRCAALAKTSCFDEASMRDLMRSLVEQMDLSRELRFGVLELNGHPLAWSFGFQSHGKYSYYQQTFDIDAEEYAPGEVLLRFLLDYAMGSVEREFDFLRGDEFFKKRYATHITQSYKLYLERAGFLGQLRRAGRFIEGVLHRTGTRIENFARSRERVFRTFRSFLMWKRNLARRFRWARENRRTKEYLRNAWSGLIHRRLWDAKLATRFASGPQAGQPFSLRLDPQTGIVVGQLSDLADLALEYPEIPFPSFREYRNRMKRGDEVYLVCRDGQLALVGWVGIHNPPVSRNASAPERQSCLTLYECWPIYDAGNACAQLLATLSDKAAREKADLLVSCAALPSASCIALEAERISSQARGEVLPRFRKTNIQAGT